MLPCASNWKLVIYQDQWNQIRLTTIKGDIWSGWFWKVEGRHVGTKRWREAKCKSVFDLISGGASERSLELFASPYLVWFENINSEGNAVWKPPSPIFVCLVRSSVKHQQPKKKALQSMFRFKFLMWPHRVTAFGDEVSVSLQQFSNLPDYLKCLLLLDRHRFLSSQLYSSFTRKIAFFKLSHIARRSSCLLEKQIGEKISLRAECSETNPQFISHRLIQSIIGHIDKLFCLNDWQYA